MAVSGRNTTRALHYILDGRTPIPCPTNDWGVYTVAKTQVGDIEVSTAFFGVDRQFSDESDAAPLLFETMIFGGDNDGDMWLDSTWEQAELRHREIVASIDPAATVVVAPPMPLAVDFQPQHWEIWRRERRASVRCGDRVINFYFSTFIVSSEVLDVDVSAGYVSPYDHIELTIYTPNGSCFTPRGLIVEGLEIACQLSSQRFEVNDLARTEIRLTPDRGSFAWEVEPRVCRFTVTPQTRTPQLDSCFVDTIFHASEVATFSANCRCFNPADALSPADIDEVHSFLASEFGLSVVASDRPKACQGCQNYHGEIYNGNRLICGIHPYGWNDGDECPDRA